MKRHSNITNEITGEYYKPERFFDFNWKQDWTVVVGTIVIIAVCGVIYWVMF